MNNVLNYPEIYSQKFDHKYDTQAFVANSTAGAEIFFLQEITFSSSD